MTTVDEVLLLVGSSWPHNTDFLSPRIQIRELTELPMRADYVGNRRVAVYRVPRQFALEYIAAEAAFANCDEMLRACPRYQWVQRDELIEVPELAKETTPL